MIRELNYIDAVTPSFQYRKYTRHGDLSRKADLARRAAEIALPQTYRKVPAVDGVRIKYQGRSRSL